MALNNLVEKVIDLTNGQENVLPLSSDRLAEIEASNLLIVSAREEQEKRNLLRKALLERLGITEEEAKLLVG